MHLQESGVLSLRVTQLLTILFKNRPRNHEMFNVTDGRKKKGSLTTRKHARILTQTVNKINCTKINSTYYFKANFLIKSPRKRHLNNFVSMQITIHFENYFDPWNNIRRGFYTFSFLYYLMMLNDGCILQSNAVFTCVLCVFI